MTLIDSDIQGLDLLGVMLLGACSNAIKNPKTDLYENWKPAWNLSAEILHDSIDPAPLTKSLALLAWDHIGAIEDMPVFSYWCRTKSLIIYSGFD